MHAFIFTPIQFSSLTIKKNNNNAQSYLPTQNCIKVTNNPTYDLRDKVSRYFLK